MKWNDQTWNDLTMKLSDQKMVWRILSWTSDPTDDLNLIYVPGGALGYFLGGYVPPGTPNWHPVLEKISPKIDTPF